MQQPMRERQGGNEMTRSGVIGVVMSFVLLFMFGVDLLTAVLIGAGFALVGGFIEGAGGEGGAEGS